MRHIRILVLVSLVALASSAFAQDDQPIFNVGPEVFTTSAMPEEEASAMRTQPVTFVPAPPRHTVSPAETGEIKLAIMVNAAGAINSHTFYDVIVSGFGSVRSDIRAEERIVKPNGEVLGVGSPGTFNPGGQDWWCQLWRGELPADKPGDRWPSGIYTVEGLYTIDGVVTRVSAKFAHSMLPAPLFGALEKVEASGGGVYLTGSFSSSVIAYAPDYANRLITLEGDGHYIPASAGFQGKVLFVVSDEVSPRVWESSTMWGYLPAYNIAPRNR